MRGIAMRLRLMATRSVFWFGFEKMDIISDTVEFTWTWDDPKVYRNVMPSSLKTLDNNSVEVVRGYSLFQENAYRDSSRASRQARTARLEIE